MRTRITLLTAAIVAAFSLGACAETPELYILNNAALDDSCEIPITTGTSGTFVSRGVLDLFLTDTYYMYPVVENSLVESNSVEYVQVGGRAQGLQGNEWEANKITMTHAEITLDIPAALNVPVAQSYEIPLAGSLTPADFATVALQLITPAVGRQLSQSEFLRGSTSSVTILARIRIHGRTATNRRVDSNEFVYPIELCFGCLIFIPAGAVDSNFPTPNCRNLDPDAVIESNTVCSVGQDQPIDCREICPLLGPDRVDPQGICGNR